MKALGRDKLALILALALAGCAAPVRSGAEDDRAAASPPPLLEYADCAEHAGFFPLSAAEADAWLPEGYDPSLPVSAPGAAAGAGALLIAVGFICERAAGLMFVVTIEPPAAFRAPEGVASVALLGMLADDADRSDAWRAWGARLLDDPSIQVDVDDAENGVSRGLTRASAGAQLQTLTEGEPAQGTGESRLRLFVVKDARTIPGFLDLTVEGGRSVGTFTSQTATAGEAMLQVAGAPLWDAVGGVRSGAAHHVWDERAWRVVFTPIAPAGGGA